MTTLTIEMPETAFSALYADPKEFSRQMRIAVLSNAKVSPLQITEEELQEELANAY